MSNPNFCAIFFFVKCVKFVRRRQKSKNSTFSRRIRHWKICLHSAWKNSKFLVKLESEKFVYIFGRQFWFFLSDRIVEKIVYIRHEKKIQNFSSNRKVQNLFTFLAENVNSFSSNRKVKKLFTFGMRRKFKISRQIGKCKICLHFDRQF